MRKISGGEISFQFYLVGDFDNERTECVYKKYMFSFHYSFKRLSSSFVCIIFLELGPIKFK